MHMSEDNLKDAGYRELGFPYSQVLSPLLSIFFLEHPDMILGEVYQNH